MTHQCVLVCAYVCEVWTDTDSLITQDQTQSKHVCVATSVTFSDCFKEQLAWKIGSGKRVSDTL